MTSLCHGTLTSASALQGADTFNYSCNSLSTLSRATNCFFTYVFWVKESIKQFAKMTVYYLPVILPRPIPVGMVTKFETKSAITCLVYETMRYL